jgi:hypothetical protein
MKIEAWDWTGVEDPYNPGMDFPTAWAIQNEMGSELEHHLNCSSHPRWAMLCDCGALREEWLRRREKGAR